MNTMELATYVLFGLALGVLALALWDQLRSDAPFTMRVTTAIGLLWSFTLVASGMVFTYEMTTIDALAATDRAQAALSWQAVEPVAQGLGGTGGELVGGLWVLLVSLVVLRGSALPRARVARRRDRRGRPHLSGAAAARRRDRVRAARDRVVRLARCEPARHQGDGCRRPSGDSLRT
jgi:hypothetical protein